MPDRKAFPLRLSPDLYEAIQRMASAELRSVNAQIEMLLREAVKRRARVENLNSSDEDIESE
ncbi:hypothetical protein QPK87_10810 [Kamptonema cortianum]|nr:hypothetical protein [Geitlerinema splendidum]MDK3157064.1 hypothetical protein [Kamptonema cortianum]